MINNEIYIYSYDTCHLEKEITLIRIFGLNEKSETVCLIIQDFYPWIYVELPVLSIPWTLSRANMVCSVIDERLKESKPVKKEFIMKKRSFGCHKVKTPEGYKTKKFPFIKLYFANLLDINKAFYLLKNFLFVQGFGSLKLKINEKEAGPELQLRCTQDIPAAGWIAFKGKVVEEDCKETDCDHEIETKYKSLKRIEKNFIPNPKVLTIDAEVYSSNPNMMPQSHKPSDKIFQLSCILSKQGESIEKAEKRLLSLLNPDSDSVGKDTKIQKYKTEADLLLGYVELLREFKPNIVCGYNILGFDIEYMIARAELNLISTKFSQQSFVVKKNCITEEINWKSSAFPAGMKFKYLKLDGRIYFDMLPIVVRDYKLDNYKLETVSRIFLGEGKDPLDHKGIFKCYEMGLKGDEKGRKALGICGAYCVKDSLVTLKLFEKLQSWVGIVEASQVCNTVPFFIFAKGQQIKVYSKVYKYCYDNNFVTESNMKTIDEPCEGATVLDPKKGIHKNVISLDFEGMYPSIIIAENIDYSTLVTDPKIPDEDCNVIKFPAHIGCKCDTTKRTTKPKKIICKEQSFRWFNKTKGILPTIIQDLLDARAKTRETIKKIGNLDTKDKEDIYNILNSRQLAFKILANSCYGSMAVTKGYLPCMEGGMCVTAVGRQSLLKAKEHIENEFKGILVYGDTDSAYIYFPHLEGKNIQEIWDYALFVESKMRGLFKPPMGMAFEKKIFTQIMFLTKKRYMWLECGRDGIISNKIGKKGVMLSRRDYSKCVKDIYSNCVTDIFKGKDMDEILDILIEWMNGLCCYKFNYKDFVITKTVKNTLDYKIRELPSDPIKRLKRLGDLNCATEKEYIQKALPAHIQLAEIMRKRGIRIDAGQRIEYLVRINPNNFSHKEDKLFDQIEDPEYYKKYSNILKIDFLYYIHMASMQIDQVLDAIFGEDKNLFTIKNKKVKFMVYQYKLRKLKYLCGLELKNLFKPKILYLDEGQKTISDYFKK